MPTIIGSKSGTRPYLELDWSVNSQDIANNRSSVKLRLFLKVDYSIGYSARYTGTLYGASFTSSSGYISSPGRYLLTQRDVWISHNSDGSKTQRLTADYNLNITWGGTYHGKITLSGDANLGTIPRASTMSAFSFGAHLKNGVANSINYTVDRKSGNFRHQIQLRDGNTTIWTWDNQNTNGSNSIALTASNVNTLLSRMSTSATKTYTLRIATRSGVGGSWIGSAVSRNATATVHADVKPAVGALSLSQTGNSVSSHYLQGKSKVKANFTRSAGYSASITNSSITIRRKGSNDDVQTINSNDGTSGRAIAHSGTYQAQGMARDSRGRTTYTAWVDFSVTAYSGPRITNFTAVRSSSAQTTVSISRAGTHTHLGGSNVLTYTVQRRIGTGAWTNVNTNPTGTSNTASFSGTSTSTGNSVTASYDFRMVITDKFGERAESVVTISTQRVVLDVHKNEGVGIGKIRERGVLDVDGQAYFKGDLHVNDVNISNAQRFSSYIALSGLTVADTNTFWQSLPQGKYFLAPSDIPNQPEPYGVIDHSTHGGDFNTIFYTQASGPIYRKSGNNNNNHAWIPIDRPDSGQNSNGAWLRFDDGLQICYHTNFVPVESINLGAGSLFRTGNITWTFPVRFTSNVTIFGNSKGWGSWSTGNGSTNATGIFVQYSFQNRASNSMHLMAIGRWK